MFLGNDVEAVQIGPDTFKDVFTHLDGGDITAFTNTDKVWVRLPGREDAYETSMAWPEPGHGRVEVAPAVLEAVIQADPDESDNVLRALRHDVETHLRMLASSGVASSRS